MRWPLVGLCFAMVVGCAQTPSAPIENRTGHQPKSAAASGTSAGKTGDTYRVKKAIPCLPLRFQ